MNEVRLQNSIGMNGGTGMLSAKVAQSIVDRTMAVLGVQVNIMNEAAVVIAAGNPQRVGQFHAGAAKVLRSGRKLSISCEEATRMEGVKPGITLPISFNGRVIGAVGMTGDPKDVESFGELLKLTAELMVEQAAVKEEIYLEQRARESLLSDLLTGHWQQYQQHFLRRAELLNFNLNRSCLVMAAEIFMEESELSSLDWYSSGDKAPVQKIRARIEELLSSLSLPGGCISSCFTDGTLAVLFHMADAERAADVEYQQKIAEKVYEAICFCEEITARLSLGGLARDWKAVNEAYRDAKNALYVGKTFYQDRKILVFESCMTEYMLTFIPQTVRRQYCEKTFGKLLCKREAKGSPWQKTLQTYLDNNMNSIETAEALFLHRNTLMFRLNKIKEATGLQPQRFQDAVRLRVAMLLMRMDEWEPQE